MAALYSEARNPGAGIMRHEATEVTVTLPDGACVSGLLRRPTGASTMLVLAHGAGAGMQHPFMEGMAGALAARGVATFRYQFPYMEVGRRRPDAPGVAEETVRAAVGAARHAAPDLKLIAGGKSFGGRMTSGAQAREPLSGVRGLVFLGFPLHAPKRPGAGRADHLEEVRIPMLFLQGSRDALADLALLRPVCDRLGKRATLRVVPDADHSFKLPKRVGRDPADVLHDLAWEVVEWSAEL